MFYQIIRGKRNALYVMPTSRQSKNYKSIFGMPMNGVVSNVRQNEDVNIL